MDFVLRVYDQATDIFKLASMNLHKWSFNSVKVVNHVDPAHRNELPLGQLHGGLEVLCLSWQPVTNVLTFAPENVVERTQ